MFENIFEENEEQPKHEFFVRAKIAFFTFWRINA